ncbi:uncharacterized protein DDB_G0284459-like isoform X3 [Trichogramma pretiosum]|uniref:uncharacterized protein DDB_G0284459-like isoform X3 n=1 Tax=Trichogramma pretiosum TaxID=7493 RepID=UPI0006C9BF9B|nr:uncharacterized protein DDB_G0284459-like isoform X3 [Trichogramma pretiosum]
MASSKNGGTESRIPVAARHQQRPSLLPKLRSSQGGVGPAANNRPRSQLIVPTSHDRQHLHLKLNSSESKSSKPPSRLITPESDKEHHLLGNHTDYSLIWHVSDNRDAENILRMNDDNHAGLLCSQEDLSSSSGGYAGKKSREDIIDDLVVGSGTGDATANLASPTSQPQQTPACFMLTKQNSFEHDESSLGILTPDQMTDFTVALDSSRTPSCENLNAQSKFHQSHKSSAIVAAAARHLDIALRSSTSETAQQRLRTSDRSPSVEDLPLDPKPVLVIEEDVQLLESTLRSAEALAAASQHLRALDLLSDLSSKTLTTCTLTDSAETSEHTTSGACGEETTTRCSAASSATGASNNSSSGSAGVGGCIIPVGQTLPTSFVTSVTSITSLEAGYQGDGENSRPASRGPEVVACCVAPVASLAVAASLPPAVNRQDPMTDSDFFTESDADAHDGDIVRGDRRAQVIDGRLFCAPNATSSIMATSNEHVRCLEPAEEMESSGVYSDLEKRDVRDVEQEAEHTTTDTGDTEVSVKSQPSPMDCNPAPALVTNIFLSPSGIPLNKNINESNSTASSAEVTVIKCQKNEQNTAMKSKSTSSSNKENSAPVMKKFKMPKRNVNSKVKTMIESNQNNVSETSAPALARRVARKNGRWDAVMDKIDASKQRGRSLKKEVKSRVLQGLGTSAGSSSTASTSSSVRRTVVDLNYTGSNNKDKRRVRNRPETNLPNQNTGRSGSVQSSASDLSSVNSKEALIERPRKNYSELHQKQTNNKLIKNNSSTNCTTNSIKTQNGSATIELPRETATVQSQQQQPLPKTTATTTSSKNELPNFATEYERHTRVRDAFLSRLQNNNNNNTSSSNNNNNNNNKISSQLHQRFGNNNKNNQHHNHQQQLRNQINGNALARSHQRAVAAVAVAKAETKNQEIQTDEPSNEAIAAARSKDEQQSKENSVAAQALAVTVQYLAHQFDKAKIDECISTERLVELRTLYFSERRKLEEALTQNEESLRHEREQFRCALALLREELEREQNKRSFLENSVCEERQRAEDLQNSLQKNEQQQREALERIEHEYKKELEKALEAQQVASVPRSRNQLVAEVESLQTVVDIRSQENAQLRLEVDRLRRELDEREKLQMRYEQMEARCEDLKAQLQSKETNERQLMHENEVLQASSYELKKQARRLTQKNEELLYKLRTRNDNGTAGSANPVSPSSQAQSKSLNADRTCEKQSDLPDQNCTSKSDLQSSSVKYFIEKSDSVSWTYDISEESFYMTCNKSTSSLPSRQINGTLVSRKNPPNLSSQKRRKNNNATEPAQTDNVSNTESSTAPKNKLAKVPDVEFDWNPACNSTPLRGNRPPLSSDEQAWSLPSNIIAESSKVTTKSNNRNAAVTATCAPVIPRNKKMSVSKIDRKCVDISTTDEDEDENDYVEEEEESGQRPQEAGGEAMISEDASAPSSSSEDESSASSSDIP